MVGTTRSNKRFMFKGAIDTIQAGGFVEGWAIDVTVPTRVVEIALVNKADIVAQGLADRYRPDLTIKGIGHGWHGFRLAVGDRFLEEESLAMSMVDVQSGQKIGTARTLDIRSAAGQTPSRTLSQAILPTDTSVVHSIDQLAAIGPALDAFIERYGIEEFVDRAYCYVLGRQSDSGGLESYSQVLMKNQIKPLDFINILYDSEERRSTKWDMFSPSSNSFPFMTHTSL